TFGPTTANTAALCARIAGCAFSVAVSWWSGPSNISRLSASRASRPTRGAAAALPETGWRGPWPSRLFVRPVRGRAKSCAARLPLHHQACPGEPGAECAEHHLHARLESTTANRLVECDRHRRGRRVAVAVHVH